VSSSPPATSTTFGAGTSLIYAKRPTL
jgi:hypothetical protein